VHRVSDIRPTPFRAPARRLFLLSAAALALAACKEAPGTSSGAASPGGGAAAGSQPVSIEAIAAQAQGFSVGSTMSTRTVYVFFDPQCPHCAALWQAAKPLKSQARFVWLPVGLLNANSTLQGATLLAAPDPVAAMDQHEASLMAKQGGITPVQGLEGQKAVVARNTELMNKFGFGSVPTVVGLHAQNGALVVKEGSMPTAALAAALGLQAPGS
jgi:thiol:disulfide interchange protein DsbG